MTMQLARNLFLSTEKTYGRKFQEIFLSVQIERRFTKDQIFELYANQIYLGHGTYGFEAGSEYYFSKHARDLTLPEAALLAALPKGPEYYSPVQVSGARAEAAQPGAERDAGGRQDYASSRRRRRRLRRWGCISSRRRTAWRRTLWKRCGGSWRRSTASKRCMARGCACIRRSISICRWWRTRRCWMGRRRMSGGMDGRGICRMSCWRAMDAARAIEHPDWAQPIEKGSYVHGAGDGGRGEAGGGEAGRRSRR